MYNVPELATENVQRGCHPGSDINKNISNKLLWELRSIDSCCSRVIQDLLWQRWALVDGRNLGKLTGLWGGEEVDSGSKITVQAMIHVYPFSITNWCVPLGCMSYTKYAWKYIGYTPICIWPKPYVNEFHLGCLHFSNLQCFCNIFSNIFYTFQWYHTCIVLQR